MTAANDAEATRNEAADAGCIAQDFLLGGRTSASAECGHWSGKAVRWSNCAILLRIYLLEKRSTLQPEATQGYGGEMAGNVPLRCRRSGPIDWLTKAQQSVWIFVPTSSFSCALNPGLRIPSISAMDKPAQNAEGSTDIYFGPKSPSPHARAAQK